VAVSGGIDSLMAALLLNDGTRQVVGLHFVTGYEKQADAGQRIIALFQPLGIPIHVLDYRRQFQSEVVDYFTRSYLDGQTPNPCVMCNTMIKFGILLESARQRGASQLATGHYARRVANPDGSYRLLKGLDRQKDQSYFLAGLTQEQLAGACFPLGELTKNRVRDMAAEAGVAAVRQRESQDVCFIGSASYTQFLAQMGQGACPGPIVTTDGRTIGTHQGLYRYTIGQRRGINCPDARPYYVVGLDRQANRLLVGRPADLLKASCRVSRVNWIGPVPQGPLRVKTRIRYRSPAAASLVQPLEGASARLCFDQPQAAVTPGQAAVFYEGETVLGGGWIDG